MSSLLWPLQTALVAAFKAHAPLVALVGQRIYDGEAPQGAGFPRVVVGAQTEAPMPVMGPQGFTDTVTCHAFSDYGGSEEALAALAAMDAALTGPLTLTGFGPATARREFAEVLVERSGETVVRHVPARYRVTTWPR